jgi:unsaturated chondroitin disaccharide hydrolase
MCGFAEQLELFDTLPGQEETVAIMEKAARATCDFYIEHTPPDGIPYWDTGAPGLAHLGDWRSRPADPFNDYEPVDSSAAAIGAQGLLRLGRRLKDDRYWKAGLKVSETLFDEPYLSADPGHQGLILHSVYHRPNGWDAIPAGIKVPAGESSMWGDYHARELGVYLLRLIEDKPYLKFW